MRKKIYKLFLNDKGNPALIDIELSNTKEIGNLLIHRQIYGRSESEKYFSITHIPSGYAVISGFNKKKYAIEIANLLNEETVFKTADKPITNDYFSDDDKRQLQHIINKCKFGGYLY